MGPFVPDLISSEMNLVVALLIGIGFGFVLEQAGFSSSRRLAGLFYGYDFTVLRVFFSAAITAMIGIMLLGYAGLLDTEAIYVNPLWLWPAVVGGAIMGVGFILGGYCPGTSICAAAIGKIDALFFIGGIFGGVFVFAEMFPSWEGFHFSSALGPQRVYDSLAMSAGVFAFVLIAIALVAFFVTAIIEKRTNPNAPSRAFRPKPHALAALAVLLMGALLITLPDRKSRIIAAVTVPEYAATHEVQRMSGDELAFRIMDGATNMQIVDVRSADEFKQFALPRAVNVGTRDLFAKEWQKLFAQRHVTKVIVANDDKDAATAYHVLRKIGYDNLAVLDGGLTQFKREILENDPPATTAGRHAADVQEFRAQAGPMIREMIEAERNKPAPVEKKAKKVAGGC
ncbi:MAG: YeeE/YedE family protein [bacterium]|nr:YeeE/YedE family protein [bacterium]